MPVKYIPMEICTLDRKKTVLDMEKESTPIAMEVITLETGSRGKWKDKGSFMIVKAI
jgi:hypothetical protein